MLGGSGCPKANKSGEKYATGGWTADARPDGLCAMPRLVVERKADGSTRVRAPQALQPIGRSITHWLAHWAAQAPDLAPVALRDRNILTICC